MFIEDLVNRLILLDKKKINEIKYKSHISLILIWLYEVKYLLIFQNIIIQCFLNRI